MEIFEPALAAKIVFSLGIINLLSGSLILLTCRCTPGSRIAIRLAGNLMQYTAYKRFFSYHCALWWIFWTSVMVHAIFALSLIGFPF